MSIETINYEGYEIKIDTTDPSNPTLKINDKDIMLKYNESKGLYYTHLFYRYFESIEILAINYIESNPELRDIHGDGHNT